MAGVRLYFEILGNFRDFEKKIDHFVKSQKWNQQTNTECLGVFYSRDIAIWNLETFLLNAWVKLNWLLLETNILHFTEVLPVVTEERNGGIQTLFRDYWKFSKNWKFV